MGTVAVVPIPGLNISEGKLKTELSNTPVMSSARVKEVARLLLGATVAKQAVWRTGVRRPSRRDISACRVIYAIPLRMIEGIESLGAKLQALRLADFEPLE